MRDWLISVFVVIVIIWALAGFAMHDDDCLCQQCEIAYDKQWEEDHR